MNILINATFLEGERGFAKKQESLLIKLKIFFMIKG